MLVCFKYNVDNLFLISWLSVLLSLKSVYRYYLNELISLFESEFISKSNFLISYQKATIDNIIIYNIIPEQKTLDL